MVFRHGIKPSDALEVIEVIIKLLCGKNIKVVLGTSACTDGVGTTYLPPLPPDSTEEDQVLFLGYGLHEGGHFLAGSNPKLMSRIKLRHMCENGVDDVRSEQDMENKKPGVTYWRKLWYQIFFDTHLSKTFPVQTKKNIGDFLHKLICLMIFRTRSQQLDMELHLNPSAELQEAYDKYLLKLEPMIKGCDTFKEALRVGGIIYDRIKKLIKDDVASKIPEPKKPEKKEKKDDKDTSDKRDSSKGSKKSKPDDAGDAEASEPESGEGSDETDGSSDTDESSGGDEKDSGTSGDGSDTSSGDEKSDAEGDSGSETDSVGDDKEVTSSGSKGNTINDKEPSSEDKKDTGGDSGSDESDSETPPESGGTEAEDTEGEDTSKTEGAAGAEGDGAEPDRSDTDSDPGEDPSESGDKPDETDTMDSEEPASGDIECDSDAAAEAEYKEACKERDRKIDKETERILRDIEGSPEDFEMPIDIWAKEINRVICTRSGPYMVAKGVVDEISYASESSMDYAEGVKKVGISLLGTKGDLMTRLFVSQTKPHTIYNQRSGSFDAMTFFQDVSDSRMDLYTEEIPGCLDKAAISFMMDNSSSMCGSIGTAYALLSGFMHYLCKAAIPVEAVGFTADNCRNRMYRDTRVILQIIKKFEDPYDGKAIRRCVPPRHLDQNAEVDCLRYMVPRLLKRPEGKKILFVVGDGQPCIGCDEINEKLAYAYKEYLELCRKAGIIVFGFGINCDLSEYFGEDFLSVETSDMGDIILKKLTEILNRKRVTA